MKKLLILPFVLASCAYDSYVPDIPVIYTNPKTGIKVKGVIGDGKFRPEVDLTELKLPANIEIQK